MKKSPDYIKSGIQFISKNSNVSFIATEIQKVQQFLTIIIPKESCI